MDTVRKLVLLLATSVMVACVPSDQNSYSGERKLNPEKESSNGGAPGPCVGAICLGQKNPTYISDCASNISNSTLAELRLCSIREPVSLAGIQTSSAQVMLLNGSSARAVLSFDTESCNLIRSSLYRSIGRSTHYDSLMDSYEIAYRSLGYHIPFGSTGRNIEDLVLLPDVTNSRDQWNSTNGRFVLASATWITGMKVNGYCELHIDSIKAAQEINDLIDASAHESIKG